MRVPERKQAKATKQDDLLSPRCPECDGEGRVVWAVTVRRQGCRGGVEYQTCSKCLGTGRARVI